MTGIHAQAYLTVHRDPKKPATALKFSPFSDGDSDNSDVTPEERERLRQSLLARSAFGPDS